MNPAAVAALKAGVAVVCAYEVAALSTGRVPTVSTLCGPRWWLRPLVVAALAYHLYKPPKGTPCPRL